MKILSATLQGFKSFEQPAEIDFSKLQPGLYFVSGENKVEPELEGNAIGKSSLFDGLFWIAFDKTSRGLRAGAVHSWSDKEVTAGELVVESAAGQLTIVRTWSPNSLTLDGSPIDQNALQSVLGMSPETFLAAVYFSQFGTSFVDLRAEEQTALFANVLELDVWERAAEQASEGAKAASAELAAISARNARLHGQAEELAEQDFDGAAAEWEEERATRAAEAAKAFRAGVAAAAAAERAVGPLKAGAEAFVKAREKVQEQARYVSGLGGEQRALEAELRKLQAKDLKKCPTCGQEIKDNKHLQAEIARVRGEIKAKIKQADLAMNVHDQLMKEMVKYRDAQIKFSDAKEALAKASADVEHAEQQVDRIKAETNPHEKAALAAAERAEKLIADIEELEEQQASYQEMLTVFQFWVKGFRDMRLAQIRESLDQLTVEANECLFQLGLHDWAIAFDVESETKSGTVRMNFSIMVLPPGQEKPVPFKSYSGGESQRLRLCVDMGFSNLICSRAGIAPNVEFWDEPTKHLNPAGVSDLLQVLADRAQRLGKVILLADHRVHDFGGFAGTFWIVKDKEGSRIEARVSSV